MIKKFNTFEKISESGKYVDIKNKYHTLGEYVEHLYNIIDDKDSFSQILGKFLKIPTKKYNSASYKVGDYILIEYWFQDLLTPVKIVDKQGRTYKVTHNIEESEIQNAPDEKITKGDIVSHYRKTEDKFLNFKVNRGSIPVKSVDAFYMLNDSLGYVKINKFANSTYNEFKAALFILLNKKMKHLVLDLRGNPGGFMGIATKIADEFLDKDKLIVFTKNKGGRIDKSFATSKGDFEKGKIYVLIDENSASASEIVAGALQDNDKGIIVGRRSFGKGLVQQEMDLGDGSAVRLTTSRYYTPTGRSIQKPYNHKELSSYENDYLERIHNGELVSKDSIKVDDELKYRTPKGKIVYGGGGIIPDVFVSIDTINRFSNALYGGLNDYIFKYIDNHRTKMSKWELYDFVENFDKDSKILNEYINQLDLNTPISPKSRENLKVYFNALMARNLFDETGYFIVTQKKDRMILKVLELESKK